MDVGSTELSIGLQPKLQSVRRRLQPFTSDHGRGGQADDRSPHQAPGNYAAHRNPQIRKTTKPSKPLGRAHQLKGLGSLMLNRD